VSAADQVLSGERPSDRQRRETRAIIRRARREGRIPRALSDKRMQATDDKRTIAELKELTSDLGDPEGTTLLHVMTMLLCLMVIVAVWEPVWLSGLAWLILAIPVTVAALLVLGAFLLLLP
jgi:hypothetical protein